MFDFKFESEEIPTNSPFYLNRNSIKNIIRIKEKSN